MTATLPTRTATWMGAESWHRRDVGDGTSLTVSRTTPGRKGLVTWSWRRTTTTGAVMAGRDGHESAKAAMSAADQALAELYGETE